MNVRGKAENFNSFLLRIGIKQGGCLLLMCLINILMGFVQTKGYYIDCVFCGALWYADAFALVSVSHYVRTKANGFIFLTILPT